MSLITTAGSGHNLILFLGADWWGSDARALAVALRHSGNALIEVIDEDFFPLQWSTVPLRALRRLARPWFVQNYNRAVLRHAGNPAIDFVLVFKGPRLQAATLERFRQQGTPIYCFYPDVSLLDHGPEIWSCLPLYDCLFTTKSFHLEDAAMRGRAKQMRLVSHGFDPEVHRPIPLSDHMRRHYGCDVSFVGCWSPKKEEMLSGVAHGCPNCKIRIWGEGWTRSKPIVRQYWQRRSAYGDELAVIYSASKINLGLLSEAGGGTKAGDAVTARTWQIPAAGGFMLHEKTAELLRHFGAGREVAVFAGAADLAGKVRYYLENDDQRLAIQASGYRACLEARCTYDVAAAEMLGFHEMTVTQHPKEGSVK
jgi:spore maturation protein CgeB